jgi:hypothetical protein
MTYEPGSMVGHGTGLFTGNRARRYLSFAAFTDGASQDHTVSSWSPISHRPALVLEINIKENPNVSCYQPRGQGHSGALFYRLTDCPKQSAIVDDVGRPAGYHFKASGRPSKVDWILPKAKHYQ